MTKFGAGLRSIVFGTALAVSVTAVVPATALDANQSVYTRKAMMWSIGAHMQGIVAGIKAKNGKVVARAANAIAAMSAALPALFVKGTHQGTAHKTRSKKAIWDNWQKFGGANQALIKEAKALAEVAKTNDPAKMLAQFKKMGKIGCGGCHRPFRGPKPK